jgi:hypothetical protein
LLLSTAAEASIGWMETVTVPAALFSGIFIGKTAAFTTFVFNDGGLLTGPKHNTQRSAGL